MFVYTVHKTTVGSHVQQQQQQANMTGLQQCMTPIDMPLLVDSTDQLGMDSDDLVPTLTVRITHQSATYTISRFREIGSSKSAPGFDLAVSAAK